MNGLTGNIQLDFRSGESITVQIVRQIEKLVRDGVLQPGDQLPTVRQMAIDLRINFSTVARAYNILDEKRLISTQRGRGTYIWSDGEPGGDDGNRELPGSGETGGDAVRLAQLRQSVADFLAKMHEQGFTLAEIRQAIDQVSEGRTGTGGSSN